MQITTKYWLPCLLLVLTSSCGPDEAIPVEEDIVIKYSLDGKPDSFVADPQIVADDASSVYVIVQLPLGVLPKKVSISTTLGSFGKSGSSTVSQTTQYTDPKSASVRFRLYAGARAGVADLTVTVKTKVDGAELEFSKFGQVAFKTACPTKLEVIPDASNKLLEFNQVPYLFGVLASRPGSVVPEDVAITFDVPQTTKDKKDAGTIFPEGRPYTDAKGRLRASLYPTLEGEILVTARSSCRLLPGTNDTETEELIASLKVTYTKPKPTPP